MKPEKSPLCNLCDDAKITRNDNSMNKTIVYTQHALAHAFDNELPVLQGNIEVGLCSRKI